MGFGIATSGLGLSTCNTARLEKHGPSACPADSKLGFGYAYVKIPIGNCEGPPDPELINSKFCQVITEKAYITIFSAPMHDGFAGIVFCAETTSPVMTRFVFDGTMRPAMPPFGERIDVDMPLIHSFPASQYVGLSRMRTEIGPEHIWYRQRRNGAQLAYRPEGILIPDRCPLGGFPFAARLNFQSGKVAKSRTQVLCSHS